MISLYDFFVPPESWYPPAHFWIALLTSHHADPAHASARGFPSQFTVLFVYVLPMHDFFRWLLLCLPHLGVVKQLLHDIKTNSNIINFNHTLSMFVSIAFHDKLSSYKTSSVRRIEHELYNIDTHLCMNELYLSLRLNQLILILVDAVLLHTATGGCTTLEWLLEMISLVPPVS